MKRNILIVGVLAFLLAGCATFEPVKKSIAYRGMYEEKPLSILLMPPINRSTSVEAKEYFHSTLAVPLANAGYYVVPTFLSMEILKRESAYDAELFLNSPLSKFGEVFGADVALFTIIHRWDKTYGAVIVEIEYILKSVKTSEVLYSRKGLVNYNTSISVQSSGGGLAGVLISAVASAAATTINTAATKYIDVARIVNNYTFKDMPRGKYYPYNPQEGEEFADQKEFKVTLNSKTYTAY